MGAFSDLRKARFRGPIGLPGEVMNRHAVVVGPAGSSKTYSLLIPWMYAALVPNWSVVAVDVKGDLREDFLDFKDAQGDGALGAKLANGTSRTPAPRCRGTGWRSAQTTLESTPRSQRCWAGARSSRPAIPTSTSATTAPCAAC